MIEITEYEDMYGRLVRIEYDPETGAVNYMTQEWL